MNKEFERNKLKFINDNTDEKINKNDKFIKYSYYEMRVSKNLSEEQIKEFIYFTKIRFENLGYKTYLTGQKYYFDHKENIVKENELLIVIK